MKNPTVEGNSRDLQRAPETLPSSDVRRVLTTILQSPPFRSSPQTQKLLTFLVLESLEGRGDLLKERMIGARLFDRPPDYDTNADPIVRLRVGEVRKRLALYYQQARDEPVLISIPSGSFKAVFERSANHRIAVPEEIPEPPNPVLTPSGPVVTPELSGAAASEPIAPAVRLRSRRLWLTAAVLLAAAAVAAVHYLPSAEERAFNKFWAPVLDNSKTVLIGLGNNPLYELSNAGEDEYYKNHPKDKFQEMGLHPYIPLSPDTPIDGKFINPAVNTYLTIGDVGALSNIEYILAQRQIKLDIRFVNDLTYGDFRQTPTILIGVHNNVWTLNMIENLRYRFQGHSTIVDRHDPQNLRQWTANFDRSETYGIVARLLNPWNGKVVMIVGGVGYSGTRAAGDFITNPQALATLAKTLPKGWESKNIEVVLHTTVKNQVPSPADVVAAYAW